MRFLIVGVMALAVLIDSAAREMHCAGAARGAHALASIDSANYRKYAPERTVDILHLAIDVTPDFKQRSVAATTTIRFTPLGPSVTELKLNAHDLRVQRVTSTAAVQAHYSTGEEIVITFAAPLPAGREQEVAITYQAFPRLGIYFRTAEMGYLPEDEHLFTQGEMIEARHWFPCFDAPNEKFTSEVTCRVPKEMTVLSNGKLVSETASTTNLKAVRWVQDTPHVAYLISLVAGHFKKIEDKYKEVPLAFYTPASQIGLAESSFAHTKEMMAFFEEETGVPYPWHKYYQVCVQDFMWGGMENTSISTLTDRTLFPKETENIRTSEGLVAHELAHQWFGDLVTCEDWSQAWLNEGFATYFEALFAERKDGRDQFLYELYGNASGLVNRSAAADTVPVVFRNYNSPEDLFSDLAYSKGAWVAHMLRAQLGPELFRKLLKTYLERHRFGTVETHDLISVVEEVSGQNFNRFFDQWIFNPHHPELDVQYAWDEQAKLAKVTIAQNQPLTNGVALFHFPLKLRFKGAFGTHERIFPISEKRTSLYIPLASAPEIFRVDPEYTLLAKISVDVPRPMLVAQLKDETDLIGRLIALAPLSKSRDQETIELIADRLRKDPFYGVRMEAAQALRTIHTDAALAELIASAQQEDARVRQKVAIEIGTFFKDEAVKHAHHVLAEEKNPDIRHHAAKALGAYSGATHFEALLTALKSDSHEEIVAEGAIAALRARVDPAAIEPLITELSNSANRFTSRGLAAGLQAVAALARDTEDKNRAYEFVLKHSTDARRVVQLAALRALGTLRDERAIPVLAHFGAGSPEAPESAAAKSALQDIRAERRPAAELQTLRTEVQDLKKQNDELKKSFEDLKKQFEARDTAPPAAEKKSGSTGKQH